MNALNHAADRIINPCHHRNLHHLHPNGIIQSWAQLNGILELPTDIKRNQKFGDQEINIHANRVSSNKEIIQGSDSTPLTKKMDAEHG